MIHHERSLTINSAPDAVWSVLGRNLYIDEFAHQITSVEALTDGEVGLGSRRRNIFTNGTSVVEEVTTWNPGNGYTVELSDMEAMPLQKASSGAHIARQAANQRSHGPSITALNSGLWGGCWGKQ